MPTETLAMLAAKEVLTKAAPPLLQRLSASIGKNMDQIKVQFVKTFQPHITTSLKRSKLVKTVLSKDKAVELEKIYVHLQLSIGEKTDVRDSEISPTNAFGSRSIISGTGGSGKTVLMKHLLNRSLFNNLGMVPLFFEFRNLDFSISEYFQDILFSDLKLSGAKEQRGLFEAALDNGLFAIFLDGFDEIKPDWQPLALQRLDAFSRRFDECSILISTRPKTGVENLDDFNTYRINGLSKAQALEVVEKTDFEKETKNKFYKALDEYLYDRHHTMMSIPILVAMMLLTFRSYSDIPDRMTVFYAQAYNTLFAIHDSEGKLQFKRQYRSQLAPDLFKNVLEAFCFLSLRNHDIEFTHNSFLDYVGKAVKLTRLNCDATAFAEDLVQNVCILQPDGVSYVFVHRSFQEYFAASFALNYSGENSFRVFDQISDPHSSSALKMINEMDKAKFSRIWLLPKINGLHEDLLAFKDAPLYVRLGQIVSWIGVEDQQLRRARFDGISGRVWDDLDKVAQIWPEISFGQIFFEKWFDKNAEQELDYLAIKFPEVFTKENRNIEERSSFGIKISIEAESWLQKTKLKELLDSHLNIFIDVREKVKKFVEKQDNLESQLLDL